MESQEKVLCKVGLIFRFGCHHVVGKMTDGINERHSCCVLVFHRHQTPGDVFLFSLNGSMRHLFAFRSLRCDSCLYLCGVFVKPEKRPSRGLRVTALLTHLLPPFELNTLGHARCNQKQNNSACVSEGREMMHVALSVAHYEWVYACYYSFFIY